MDDKTKRQISLDLQQACLLSEFIGKLSGSTNEEDRLELSQLTEARNEAVARIRQLIANA
jgi:hypothetical protein